MAEQEQTRTAEDEAADLAAGFDAARQGVSSTSEPPEAEDETEGSEVEEETPTPEPEIPGLGMTAAQVRDQLQQVQTIREQFEQQIAKAHGKIGEMNRTIQELRERKPSGGPGKLNEKALQRLKDEYGDELADTLSTLFVPAEEARPAEPAAAQQPDLSAVFEEKLKTEVGRLTGDFNERLLTIAHPDWRQVPHSPEFQAWASALSPERQHDLMNSNDATWVAQQLTAFKTWRSEQAKTQGGKSKRLETAVVPQGTSAGPPAKSNKDPFEAGFYAARGT